jgi:hypothetical protein
MRKPIFYVYIMSSLIEPLNPNQKTLESGVGRSLAAIISLRPDRDSSRGSHARE